MVENTESERRGSIGVGRKIERPRRREVGALIVSNKVIERRRISRSGGGLILPKTRCRPVAEVLIPQCNGHRIRRVGRGQENSRQPRGKRT